MMKNVKKIGSKIKNLFLLKNWLILALLLLVVIQFVQTQRAMKTFGFLQNDDSSLIKEIGQIKESYSKIGNDLNETRDFLRMPKSNYFGFSDSSDAKDADQNQNDIQLALFKYVDYLGNQKARDEKIAANKSALSEVVKDADFKQFLTTEGLTSQFDEDKNSAWLKISDTNKETLITYYLSKEDAKLFFKTLNSKQEVYYKDQSLLSKDIQKFITENKQKLIAVIQALNAKQKEISEAIKSKPVQDILAKLKIKLEDKFIDQNLKITYSVYNNTGELIGEIVLDSNNLSVSLIDKNAENVSLTVSDIATALPPFLEKLQTKTFIEKKADKAVDDLQKTLNDDGFKLLLNKVGLKISAEPRVDGDRLFFDITDADDKVVNSLVVEKATGVINIVGPNGANSQNLLYFQQEDKKKTLEIPQQIPDYSSASFGDGNDFNVLIAGENSGLVDTMIFVHINEKNKEIKMISIPRDLFYNGRKINAFAEFYGMPSLKKALSDMTGYTLDKYIKVDMYAFIDVIDLIGGVDVHLDDAVIDPTYRVVDNGKEGTLHYEPGDYHLGGVQALRLARTRHTSSDFARAERQQKIIESLQSKAQNFGFGDLDTIYQIAKTVLAKTDTDIGLDEAISYYFKYQNYKIVSNDVISSGNILYVPPYITKENCDSQMAAMAASGGGDPGCANQNHAYTLLPMDNNWNVIKWFFKEKFE